jgi:hypothetical protein
VAYIYHIFEILPEGSTLWKAGADEADEALRKLDSLAKICPNELRIVDVRRKKVVASKAARRKAEAS